MRKTTTDLLVLVIVATACTRGEQPRGHNTAGATQAQRPQPGKTTGSTTSPNLPADTSPMAKVRDDARRRGIDFRAVGQEPGWLVEINQNTSMHVLVDYGDREFTMPAPVREVNANAGVTTYRASTASHTVTVRVEKTLCHDGMSGFPFEATVRMTVDGKSYKGCGEALQLPNVSSVPLTCRPSVVTDRDTLALTMRVPHGPYLTAQADTGGWYFIVFPRNPPQHTALHSVVPSGIFQSASTTRFLVRELRAAYWVAGHDTNEVVWDGTDSRSDGTWRPMARRTTNASWCTRRCRATKTSGNRCPSRGLAKCVLSQTAVSVFGLRSHQCPTVRATHASSAFSVEYVDAASTILPVRSTRTNPI